MSTNSRYDKVFVSGLLTVIDFLNPDTGKSYVNGETLEQIQARYPGAQLVDFELWNAAKEKALCTEPEPSTEERFLELLEVLPPQRWQRGTTTDDESCESFELCEHTSGRVTTVCVRIGEKYFEFQAIAGQKLETHIAHCTPELNRVAVALAKVIAGGAK